MDRAEALRRFGAFPVARLGTVREDGSPHLVPVVFCLVDETVVTVVDHKPKRTTSLQRLRNVAGEPRVSFLVDEYREDWERLWWVRVDASAVVVEEPRRAWLEALEEKYPQYATRPPRGPALAASVERVRWWEASPTDAPS